MVKIDWNECYAEWAILIIDTGSRWCAGNQESHKIEDTEVDCLSILRTKQKENTKRDTHSNVMNVLK